MNLYPLVLNENSSENDCIGFLPCVLPLAILTLNTRSTLFSQHVISTSYYVQMALHSHCNLLSIVLIIMTIIGLRSAYMVLISTMFYFFSTFLNVCFNFINKGNKWLYLHCIGQIFPCLYYFYVMIQMLQSMIPIGARAYDGALRNPEITISLIIALFTVLSTGFYVSRFRIRWHLKTIYVICRLPFLSCSSTERRC